MVTPFLIEVRRYNPHKTLPNRIQLNRIKSPPKSFKNHKNAKLHQNPTTTYHKPYTIPHGKKCWLYACFLKKLRFACFLKKLRFACFLKKLRFACFLKKLRFACFLKKLRFACFLKKLRYACFASKSQGLRGNPMNSPSLSTRG